MAIRKLASIGGAANGRASSGKMSAGSANHIQFAQNLRARLARTTGGTTSKEISKRSPQFPLVKKFVIIFLLLILTPLGISTASYLAGDRRGNWQMADRSSAGLLPRASEHPDALVRVFAARTVRWRGILAVHTWIVVKERGGSRYSRYDYTAWGEPIRVDGFVPDGRWFGARPETVVGVDGDEAEKLIPKIRNAIETYKFRAYGDYSAWPGPNSNTFVQAVLDAVPELAAVLPPTAIGKDYPYRGEWCGLTSSGTGLFISL